MWTIYIWLSCYKIYNILRYFVAISFFFCHKVEIISIRWNYYSKRHSISYIFCLIYIGGAHSRLTFFIFTSWVDYVAYESIITKKLWMYRCIWNWISPLTIIFCHDFDSLLRLIFIFCIPSWHLTKHVILSFIT